MVRTPSGRNSKPGSRKPLNGRGGHCCRLGGVDPLQNGQLTVPRRFIVIFRAWRTDKDGNRVYAKDYGLRAWRLVVPVK